MTSKYTRWYHPYRCSPEYKKKVAYFSMEFGVDQALKIYSGGLGFLAGSHMKSAYDLKQNLIGVGILWKYGYYDQARNDDQTLRVQWIEKIYNYLEDTGIVVPLSILDNQTVYVKAYVLKPETFNTAPIYLLTTDIPENDFLSRTITHKLYDGNTLTRMAQSMVLGIGGAKIVEELGGADIYHLNEGHGLPAAFSLYQKYNKDLDKVKEHLVFTTHTPEKAGNEEHEADFLNKMGFFCEYFSKEELSKWVVGANTLSYTVTALRMAKISNGVSKIHADVANDMWKDYSGISEIIPITNAQNHGFWTDKPLEKAFNSGKDAAIAKRKKELKKELFRVVADQTGTVMDPNVLTIVWARRFAGYKRADLMLKNFERFTKLITNEKYPVQIIWAGKPYPLDEPSITTFNHLVNVSKGFKNMAVLTGYEIRQSRLLKEGADIWLNNPRIPREASGTSGMTACMNGAVNVSTFDGWMPEFGKDGENCFLVPPADLTKEVSVQDDHDFNHLYDIFENKILPLYYDKPADWMKIVKASFKDVAPFFTSRRMADDYYKKMYAH
ncbi:MAG: alpha-glucan family phosphorylase [Bacteroidota bacterium]